MGKMCCPLPRAAGLRGLASVLPTPKIALDVTGVEAAHRAVHGRGRKGCWRCGPVPRPPGPSVLCEGQGPPVPTPRSPRSARCRQTQGSAGLSKEAACLRRGLTAGEDGVLLKADK